LGIGFFELNSDVADQFSHLQRGFLRVGMRGFGFVFIPFRLSRSVSTKPFEEPEFRSPHFLIDRNRGFPLQVLFHGHFSQDFFFHRITSWVGFVEDIIKRFQPKGNRCTGTKTDIKG
jgi:hypothetical protein